MYNMMIKGLIVDFNCLFLGRMRGEFDKFKMIFLVLIELKIFLKVEDVLKRFFFYMF